jgi:hypothetical protein
MKREYWDIELPNQSKKRMEMLQFGLQKHGGIIHDSDEPKYFQGKQAWRNPLALRVSLPKGSRFPFILDTRIWLHRLPQIQLGLQRVELIRRLPLRGNHSTKKIRRTYHINNPPPWLKDYNPDGTYHYVEGMLVSDVLNGEMDRLPTFQR